MRCMTVGSITSATSIFSQMEKQRRFFDSLYRPSALQTMLDQQAKQDRMLGLAKPPLLEQIITGQTRQNRLLGNLTEPSAVERMIGQVERTNRLVSSSVLDQILRQQRIFDGLTQRTTLLQALVTGPAALPSELIVQAERYREALQDEVAEVATELPTAMPDVLGRLADERETILICLKRIGQIGMVATCFGVKLPPAILGLVIVFLVLGEVADEVLTERAGDEADAA